MSRNPTQSWILDSTTWTAFFVSGLGLRILIVGGIPESKGKHFLDSGIRVPLLWGEKGFERRKLTVTTNHISHRTYKTWYKNNGADGNIGQLFAWRQFSSIRRIFNSITLEKLLYLTNFTFFFQHYFYLVLLDRWQVVSSCGRVD